MTRGLLRAGAVILILFQLPAQVLADGLTPPFAEFVDVALSQTVLPDHQHFEDATGTLHQSLQELCGPAEAPILPVVRQRFREALAAWSRIEMYRFGPARQNNLYERLFFWPDSRSRGLRQVQRVLLERDETVTTADQLRRKSVAVQGLMSLEFVLFGDGADILSTSEDVFRCTYAKALGEVIHGHAKDLNAGWRASDGHAEVMRLAGSPDAFYRNDGEAARQFFRAIAEQLELIRDLKVARVMADEGPWYPRRAVFHRSGSVLLNMESNIASIESLLSEDVLRTVLIQDNAVLSRQWGFELQAIKRTLDALKQQEQEWETLVAQPQSQAQLRYMLQPLTGAYTLAGESIPQALGLIVGFNSLDGD